MKVKPQSLIADLGRQSLFPPRKQSRLRTNLQETFAEIGTLTAKYVAVFRKIGMVFVFAGRDCRCRYFLAFRKTRKHAPTFATVAKRMVIFERPQIVSRAILRAFRVRLDVYRSTYQGEAEPEIQESAPRIKTPDILYHLMILVYPR